MTNYDPIAPTHAFTHQHGGDDPLPMTIWDFYEIGDIHITTRMPDPIPQGWELIGQDRVLIGAGTSYEPEDTGGAETAGPLSHAGAGVSAHKFTGANDIALPHSGAAVDDHDSHTHAISSTLDSNYEVGATQTAVDGITTPTAGPNATLTHNVTQPGTHTVPAPDNHTFTQADAHAAFSILPPYFAVYFFMRVS